MREIKYRAWDESQQKMYKVLMLWPGGQGVGVQYIDLETSNITLSTTAAKEGIYVMQFTGLKDKNSKDIYDGDRVKRRILSDGMDYIDIVCDVRWEKWCFCLYIHNKYITCLDTAVANGSEVIGHIYEK